MLSPPNSLCLTFLAFILVLVQGTSHLGPLDVNIAVSPFSVEVKGPASQILHRQSLEYRNRKSWDNEQHRNIHEGPEIRHLPPSKVIAGEKHASVFSVALFTFLMAAATVIQFFSANASSM